jgi:hypothetical protein
MAGDDIGDVLIINLGKYVDLAEHQRVLAEIARLRAGLVHMIGRGADSSGHIANQILHGARFELCPGDQEEADGQWHRLKDTRPDLVAEAENPTL